MNPAALETDLAAAAREGCAPDATTYRSLPVGAVQALAQKFGVPGWRIEAQALASGLVPERYVRNRRSFTAADQMRLLESAVGVVGLGGLGGTVAEVLARTGVGRLTLIDGDRFDESNLNRQILSTTGQLGRPKAQAAATRLAEVNPSVETRAWECFLEEGNGARLLAGVDVVVDGLDTLTARLSLQAVCRRQGLPLVTAAVAGAAGQLTVVFPGDPGLETLYGPADQMPARGAEAELGTLPFAVMFLANLECAETVKILLGRGRPLRRRLLIFDLLDTRMEVMALE
jgi:molybdopterin/thiamine biosynthesis adenylyltransferase